MIRGRIKSVKNTRKITKAMELVAASKMRRAVYSVLATRPYAKLSWDTINAISQVIDVSHHPLLSCRHQASKTLLLLFTSDRGLAGGFNNNMIKKMEGFIENELSEEIIEVVAIGKRGSDAMRKSGRNLIASFTNLTNHPKFEDILPLGRMVINEFIKGTYKEVWIAYTDFASAISQKPNILKLLPLGKAEDLKDIGEVGKQNELGIVNKKLIEYTFEPSPFAVLDRLLPRLIETMLYQALLESAASEHSARMMSMRNASDAASDMMDRLTFTYNQARQAGITREIAEISSGKAALE